MRKLGTGWNRSLHRLIIELGGAGECFNIDFFPLEKGASVKKKARQLWLSRFFGNRTGIKV